MAKRVTATEVKQIITTTQEDYIIDVFIESANLLVTSILADSGLSSDLLKEIERWLSAHFLSMSFERQTIREEIGGDTSEQYSKLGHGLSASTYGQTVKMLDTTGMMDAAINKKMASITAVTSFES